MTGIACPIIWTRPVKPRWINFSHQQCFQSWLLPASLPVVIEWAEPIEMSHHGIDRDRLLEEERKTVEALSCWKKRKCWDQVEKKMIQQRVNEEVLRIGGMRVGDMVDASAASIDGSSKGPTQSLASSSICINNIEDFHCQLGGWAAWIKCMGPLLARYQA